MSSEDSKLLESSVLGAIGDRLPSEHEVDDLVARIGVALGYSQESREAVRRAIVSNLLIRMDTGTKVVDDSYRPWLTGRAASIDPYYWSRYEEMLNRQRMPRAVISGLAKATDDILDLCGDPKSTHDWSRRGLVMGDVQSGKTGTYAGLICKAADSGYGLVILLTGTLESLRRQTQERLDAAFVGFDSSGELKRKREGKLVGVGNIRRSRNASVFTSRTSDFKTAILKNLGLSLASLREPALFVVKKNPKILENLRNWLADPMNTGADGKVDVPLLLIDDEADNASVNTSKEESKPTTINAG